MLASFSSATISQPQPTPAVGNTAPVSTALTPAEAASELERNLAATKARKSGQIESPGANRSGRSHAFDSSRHRYSLPLLNPPAALLRCRR